MRAFNDLDTGRQPPADSLGPAQFREQSGIDQRQPAHALDALAADGLGIERNAHDIDTRMPHRLAPCVHFALILVVARTLERIARQSAAKGKDIGQLHDQRQHVIRAIAGHVRGQCQRDDVRLAAGIGRPELVFGGGRVLTARRCLQL